MMKSPQSWNGLVEMVRRVSSARGRAAAGLYVIEGNRLIRRAMRAGAPLRDVLVAEGYAAYTGSPSLPDELVAAGIPVTLVEDKAIDELIEGRTQGAILALVSLPPSPTLPALLEAAAPQPALFLAAVDIVDPGNAGALVRTAHASEATGYLAAGATDPYHPRATRISRGSIFKCPVVGYPAVESLFEDLQAGKVLTAATVVRGGRPLGEFEWPRKPLAVLMGNEGEGLPATAQAKADLLVTIPMAAGIDSLAVNAAAAVMLYDIRRQWAQGD